MRLGDVSRAKDNAGNPAQRQDRRVTKIIHTQRLRLPGNAEERAFWQRTLERGEIGEGDLERAIGYMTKYGALEDTIARARHYGAMACDALAIFPASEAKSALLDAVAFCISRAH